MSCSAVPPVLQRGSCAVPGRHGGSVCAIHALAAIPPGPVSLSARGALERSESDRVMWYLPDWWRGAAFLRWRWWRCPRVEPVPSRGPGGDGGGQGAGRRAGADAVGCDERDGGGRLAHDGAAGCAAACPERAG